MSFAALHRPGEPFVLPNAWDVGTARALVAAGFPAVGTTSLGITAGHGLLDGARAGLELTVGLTEQLLACRLGAWITCDLEDGFSDDPTEVAALVHSLGVDGVNLEDSTHGVLVDPELHARKIAAVKATCPQVFLNARTDVFWVGDRGVTSAVERLRRYADAGADGIFLPGDLDTATIEAVTTSIDRPLNVLASPTLTRTTMGEAGVARISTGSLLYRAALLCTVTAAISVRDDQRPPAAMSYDDVQALHRPAR